MYERGGKFIMKEVDRAICLEVEKALTECGEDKSFVEILYDLGVIAPEMETDEASEITYDRVKEKVGTVIPKTPIDCIKQIEMVCHEAIDAYDREEFYEDDCDSFMGESMMAEKILEIIGQFDAFVKMVAQDEKQ